MNFSQSPPLTPYHLSRFAPEQSVSKNWDVWEIFPLFSSVTGNTEKHSVWPCHVREALCRLWAFQATTSLRDRAIFYLKLCDCQPSVATVTVVASHSCYGRIVNTLLDGSKPNCNCKTVTFLQVPLSGISWIRVHINIRDVLLCFVFKYITYSRGVRKHLGYNFSSSIDSKHIGIF